MEIERNNRPKEELNAAIIWQKFLAQREVNQPISRCHSLPDNNQLSLLEDTRSGLIVFGGLSTLGVEAFLLAGAAGAALSGDVKATVIVSSFTAGLPAALTFTIHSLNQRINELRSRIPHNSD